MNLKQRLSKLKPHPNAAQLIWEELRDKLHKAAILGYTSYEYHCDFLRGDICQEVVELASKEGFTMLDTSYKTHIRFYW